MAIKALLNSLNMRSTLKQEIDEPVKTNPIRSRRRLKMRH